VKNIHLIMPHMRSWLRATLIRYYEPMNIILHPIMFENQVAEGIPFDKAWIEPFIIQGKESGGKHKMIEFFKNHKFIDEDYYVYAADDGMFESNVFSEIKKMDDDVIVISMKRGDNVPQNVDPIRQYPISTLLACPGNMKIGYVDGEQIFIKGKYYKNYQWVIDHPAPDGVMAEYFAANYPITYRPDLFMLFNYFEPGRWVMGPKISFGCMVNDPLRVNMVLQQSKIQGSLHYIQGPESATKGLNKLLDIIEKEGADIGILTHQDMFYRAGWLDQVKEQLAKLPDSWVVAGIIGKDLEGRIAGQFHDMRIPLNFNTKHIHEFPQPACCFDECTIIVNMKKGFRFDENLTGFDLYGTLCVLQTWEMGGTAWILDAFAEHYCMRPFTWHPDESFCKNYKWLFDRFDYERIDSTALGLPEGQKTRELIIETAV